MAPPTRSASRPMQHPNWCFTAHYGEPQQISLESLEALVAATAEKATYLIAGKEVAPTTGQKHLQGYAQFKKPHRLSEVVRFIPCHWEPAKGDDQANYDYCSKEGEFNEFGERRELNPGRREQARWDVARASLEAGTMPEDSQIYINHYSNCKMIIKDFMVMPEMLDEPCGIWIHGEAGVGKSFKARQDYPDAYLKLCNKWWDGFQPHHQNVIIDDFDHGHHMLGHHLKVWADRYPFIAEIKGGAISIRPRVICVTSQYSPEDIWADRETRDAIKRRFKVIRLGAPTDAPAGLRAAFIHPPAPRTPRPSPEQPRAAPGAPKKAPAVVDLTGSDSDDDVHDVRVCHSQADSDEEEEELFNALPLRRSTAGQFKKGRTDRE